ncbi:HAMP domain-containing protein [Leptolyngbya ohadii]|uniref:HAMP domain-containing protein n=1 Tax=Leptolyngbya ohadii TaxID=1962290 RepID=UPI000B59B734|nr:HAMP domain-containing protein [Leptolyngbya ohadii]
MIRSLKNHLKHAKFPKPGTSSLKVSLVGAMLATVGATAAIVYLPWAVASRRNVDAMMTQVNQEVANSTRQEVKRLFLSAQSAQQLVDSSFTQKFVALSNLEEQEAFFLSTLAANPDFTWIQLGYANGDFVGVQRTTTNLLKFHLRDWNPTTRTTQSTVRTYQVKNQDFQQVEQQSMQMNPAFYAPDRPWYQNAIQTAGKSAWTVYVYRSTNTPGMDATIRLQNGQKTIGVIGVGIELTQLSRYLERMKENAAGDGTQRVGEAFILNSKAELIASTDSQEVMPQPAAPGQLQLRQFNQTRNLMLQFASKTIANQNIDLSRIEAQQEYVYTDPQTGENYRISLAPVGYLGWVVGSVIPEANYLTEINRNKQILLVVITLFVVTAAGVAIVAVDRMVARPIVRIAQTAADIEAEKFELDSLASVACRADELGQLARMFQKMAQQVYLREQRLKQQVQELKIEIDEAKRQKQVQEIVETDFFQDLVGKAQTLRQRKQSR